jgi:small-conductance mechanosensitive channel
MGSRARIVNPFGSTKMNLWMTIKSPSRIILIIAIAIGAHLLVLAVKMLGQRLMKAMPQPAYAKGRSITSLLTSAAIFSLYFGAVGLILKEFGVSLTAYLASASVVGLAIGFGSQGFVQDVVTGLTLIFSDLVDVDDMVEISGQTGIVTAIGMRFIGLKNSIGADVFIPNRTITNVVSFPRGYVRCFLDVRLSSQEDTAQKTENCVKNLCLAAYEQYAGIFVSEPLFLWRIKTSNGSAFLRVEFRIWPGRGELLETTLKQQISMSIRKFDSEFSDCLVSVGYELESRLVPIRPPTQLPP